MTKNERLLLLMIADHVRKQLVAERVANEPTAADELLGAFGRITETGDLWAKKVRAMDDAQASIVALDALVNAVQADLPVFPE